jgi:adenosylcobinamide-GDP ribazoletransferase
MQWDGLRLSLTLLTAIPVAGSHQDAEPADTGPAQPPPSSGEGWLPGTPPAGDWEPGTPPAGAGFAGTQPAETLPVEIVPADAVLADAGPDDAGLGDAGPDNAGLGGTQWHDAGADDAPWEDMGLAGLGLADTRPADMRPASMGPADTGPADTGPAGIPGAARGPVTRHLAGQAMAWAPAVGLGLGIVAAAVLFIADRLLGTGSLVAAVLAVASLALMTRGLHLDGLADLADGLGSRKPADQALTIMRRSDIGPFGVAALVLTLLVQVAALSRAEADGHGIAALLAAAVTGRLALAWACRTTVPPARRDGLGALVAGTLRPAIPVALTAAVLAAAVAAAGSMIAVAGIPSPAPWTLPVAVAAGLAASLALTAHAVRRLGGITGDVLGALVEIATAVCLAITAMS